jgi:hypothetical protein
LSNWTDLEGLRVPTSKMTDEGFEQLRGSTGLRNLLVYAGEVTDEGLDHLAELTRLEELELGDLPITGSGLSSLAALTGLRRLDLIHNQRLRADNLQYLSNFPLLEELCLEGVRVENKGLRLRHAELHLSFLVIAEAEVVRANPVSGGPT